MWSVPDHDETCMATLVPPTGNAAQATEWIGLHLRLPFGGSADRFGCAVRVRSAMVTVEQLLSRQIALFRAVGDTVEHGNSTAIPPAGVLYGCPRDTTLGERRCVSYG